MIGYTKPSFLPFLPTLFFLPFFLLLLPFFKMRSSRSSFALAKRAQQHCSRNRQIIATVGLDEIILGVVSFVSFVVCWCRKVTFKIFYWKTMIFFCGSLNSCFDLGCVYAENFDLKIFGIFSKDFFSNHPITLSRN